MTDVHARLRYARVTPRKMRLVARAVRGLPVPEAEIHLTLLAPKSARLLLKLLRSAMANAKQNFDLKPSDLVVRDVTVNAGATLKRFMPRARGAASRIEKKTAHVSVVLSEREPRAAARGRKATPVVTRRVEELSREELAQAPAAHGEPGRAGGAGGAVRKPDRPTSARRLYDRRASDA